MQVTMPSERKFEVYHAVQTQHLSRREAARRFQLSVTRIQQIVTEVREFVIEHGSEAMLNLPPAQLELASLRVGHEKLCFYERKLMRQWNAEANGENVGATIRLLHAAARIVVEQTKLVARIAKVQLEMQEAGLPAAEPHTYVEEGAEEAVVPSPACDESALPPDEDCTPEEAPLRADEERLINEVIASLGPNATCEQVFQAVLQRSATELLAQNPCTGERVA